MNLEKPKRLIIWNGLIVLYQYLHRICCHVILQIGNSRFKEKKHRNFSVFKLWRANSTKNQGSAFIYHYKKIPILLPSKCCSCLLLFANDIFFRSIISACCLLIKCFNKGPKFTGIGLFLGGIKESAHALLVRLFFVHNNGRNKKPETLYWHSISCFMAFFYAAHFLLRKWKTTNSPCSLPFICNPHNPVP